VKVFYTGENQSPDFNLCDYAIGFDYAEFGDRYLRFPIFALEQDILENITTRNKRNVIDVSRRDFCNFIYSNPNADPIRDRFFHTLNSKIGVHSLGRHLRNISNSIEDRFSSNWRQGKVDVMGQYNFSIAFENSSVPGYTTEKISHAFAAGTIPIYWGNPKVCVEFNPKAFVNVADFSSLDDCANYIVKLNNHPDQISAILSEPVFLEGSLPEDLRMERIKEFILHICHQAPSARARRSKYGRGAIYVSEMKKDAKLVRRYRKSGSPVWGLRKLLTKPFR
jgi:hypothetical protein